MDYATAAVRWVHVWLDGIQEMPLDAALDLLAIVKRHRRWARSLERVIEDVAIAEMTMRDMSAYSGNGYTVILHPGERRTDWDDEKVMNDLIDAAVTRQARRHPGLDKRALRRVLTEEMWRLHEHAARPRWRSTMLRAAGFDPNEYSAVTAVPASLEMRGDATYTHPERSHP